MGLIETTGLRGGQLQRADGHRARLEASARALGLTVPADLDAQIAAALADATIDDGRLRIELAPGHLLVEVVPSPPTPQRGCSSRP